MRILALSPHTDDIELAAGGSLARWIEEGKEVIYVAFSIAEKSIPEGLPKNVLEDEVKKATHIMGIKKENLFIYKFDVRMFPLVRQQILDLLVKLKENLKPEVVLLPSLKDIHQDHHVVSEEGLRAFKNISILAYELPWNLISSSPSLFVSLGKKHLEKKMKAIDCYQSQKHRNYTDVNFIYGWARTRGIQVNVEYAEAFEVVRWVIT